MRVYTGGTFDLFHAGHVHFLRRCRHYNNNHNSVIVGLNTDEFVEEYKGQRPVMSYAERYEVVSACKYVDEVIPNLSGADSKPTIALARPHVIVVGDDWKDKDYLGQLGVTQEMLAENGVEIRYVPYTKNISTSDIKKRIWTLPER